MVGGVQCVFSEFIIEGVDSIDVVNLFSVGVVLIRCNIFVLYYIGVMIVVFVFFVFDVFGMLVVWVDVDGCVVGCNFVFLCWLGVSGCCLVG